MEKKVKNLILFGLTAGAFGLVAYVGKKAYELAGLEFGFVDTKFDVKPDGVYLDAYYRIDNKSNKSRVIDSVRGKIYSNDVPVGEVNTIKSVAIPGNGTQLLPLRVKLNLASIGINVGAILRDILNGSLNLKFEGSVQSDGVVLPFVKEFNPASL